MIARSLKLCLLGLASLGAGALAGLGLVARLGGERAFWWVSCRCTSLWARTLCRILRVRIRHDGAYPPGPVLIAPNHSGYLDILVLASLGHVFFVSKADIARWPVMGVLARLGSTLFIERTRRKDAKRVAGVMERRLAAGHRLVVFLEGRAGPGDRVLPFRPPLVQSAVWTGAPCQPVALHYVVPGQPELDTTEVIAWHDGRPIFPHGWRLLGFRRIEARVSVMPTRIGRDRKRLSAELESDVRGALETLIATPAGAAWDVAPTEARSPVR